MKIAITGTHSSGKSTLALALVESLAGYTYAEEPYHQLSALGQEFSDIPTVDEFFDQLTYSVKAIKTERVDCVFDRSPLDFLAYAQSLPDSDPIDEEDWIDTAREALEALDLLIYCPIESPDRIVAEGGGKKLRQKVDKRLRKIVLDDFYGVLEATPVLEVSGSLESRLKQVLSEIQNLKA